MKKFFAAVTVALLIISLQLSVRAECADECPCQKALILQATLSSK